VRAAVRPTDAIKRYEPLLAGLWTQLNAPPALTVLVRTSLARKQGRLSRRTPLHYGWVGEDEVGFQIRVAVIVEGGVLSRQPNGGPTKARSRLPVTKSC